jgi:hypothetical protein
MYGLGVMGIKHINIAQSDFFCIMRKPTLFGRGKLDPKLEN